MDLKKDKRGSISSIASFVGPGLVVGGIAVAAGLTENLIRNKGKLILGKKKKPMVKKRMVKRRMPVRRKRLKRAGIY